MPRPNSETDNSKLSSPSTRPLKLPNRPSKLSANSSSHVATGSELPAAYIDPSNPSAARHGGVTPVTSLAEPTRDVISDDDHQTSTPQSSSHTLGSSSGGSGPGQTNMGRKKGEPPLVNTREVAGGTSRDAGPASVGDTGDGAFPPMKTSQKQLNEYRERLGRDLERRELHAAGLISSRSDRTRVPLIPEHGVPGSTPLLSSSGTPTSPSTGSSHTVRSGMTPAPVAGTPSYPFPRMAPTFAPHNFQKPYPPTRAPQTPYTPTGAQDRLLSGGSTPASNFTFDPSGASPQYEDFDLPNPNLYDLSLMLAAEPGLDAWWTTVVQIMKDVFKAERVTLAVPADTTDIENVPWGQKATYNEHHESDFSLDCMPRGSSAVVGSEADASGDMSAAATPLRPGLPSRHSFTSYENKRKTAQEGSAAPAAQRPVHPMRSKSHYPATQIPQMPAQAHSQLNKHELDKLDAMEERQGIPGWESLHQTPQNSQGRVLPVLQALDFEADPLIDHTGVMRVLERGKAVALTRSYPYLANSPTDHSTRTSIKQVASKSPNMEKQPRKDANSKTTSVLPGSTSSRGANRGKGHLSTRGKGTSSRFDEEEAPRPPTPQYEEYEQAPPSPWSQSPAPSPAIRSDTMESPFFTDATVDEDSFNPGTTPADYTGLPPPEAIGVDNSWTVLHIPLTHVLLSKPVHMFKLDTDAIEQRVLSRSKDEQLGTHTTAKPTDRLASESSKRDKPSPIAILSVLSQMIPYPANLRHALEHLAPHMATSFSLCRHYSNLETELAGLQRRRPPAAGFGAVDPDGRPMDSAPYLTVEDIVRQTPLTDTMTSPSDYSMMSKSATNSPSGTPGWDHGSLGYVLDRRQPMISPAARPSGAESYFSSKNKSGSGRQSVAASESHRSRPTSREFATSDRRYFRLSNPTPLPELHDVDEPTEGTRQRYSDDNIDTTVSKTSSSAGAHGAGTESLEHSDADSPMELRGEAAYDVASQHRSHSMLHSYGADFDATFQSLPRSSTITSKPSVPAPPRSGTLPSSAADMPQPSIRLKGLILESLPAHVFVALPLTGEIVWVNSRYLSYRGQTVAALAADPWASIHAADRAEYLKAWAHSLRTGEQFSRTVRIKRFDGAYRWFQARALASKDKRGVIMQFLGSYMDIHDQHIAELKAARQEEIEASEAKHRLLANLIPQIIFTATEEDGITFANDQWLSYTGQTFEDALGLGFMDYVHPEDLAKCRIPTDQPPMPLGRKREQENKLFQEPPSSGATSTSTIQASKSFEPNQESNLRGVHQAFSRNNSSSSGSVYELPTADLTELAKKGVVKVGVDSNGRLSYTTEVRLRSKAGDYRWHLIRCVEIDTVDFGNGASSYFGSATDINDLKLLEVKLKEAMESKGRFLSNMSHEIRTPLIGISGMVSFLQDTTLNEEQRDYTNTIQTSANSLIMIINDILDLSKVDAGMMKLKYEWFHTRSLIEDVNELVSTMATSKRLELNYLVEADVPSWVKGDKVRIRQVLLNVIGNAIKFTSEGEVFSRCKVHTSSDLWAKESGIVLEYAITDTGQGFSKEEADLIFKPFSQIDGSSTRQHGGSGLGLVISRQLVELHGGKMEGTAVVGKGSTFSFTAKFTLPTADDHPKFPASSVSATSRHESTDSIPGRRRSQASQKPRRSVDESNLSGGDVEFDSPAVTSTGSSVPSLQSLQSHITDISSVPSVNSGLARFSEAAKASGHDLTHMKLEMPSRNHSPGTTPTQGNPEQLTPEDFRPPMYSIMIICPQDHSREATTQHIEMTLPKGIPHQITALATAEEAKALIGGEDPITFTHIVINLGSAEAIITLMDQITKSQQIDRTMILILSDFVQRQAVVKLAAGTKFQGLLSGSLVTFIYKPVKPSRFAVIFDPERVGDLSIDRNRSTAQQLVADQKASDLEIEKLIGNKGYKVLLVEDNPINQKVMTKFLKKIGLEVESAVDGVECTDAVFSKPPGYYSLILCDLHMPRKDGYRTCRDVRHWERAAHYPAQPIIALSANVMSDVPDKCRAAGFSDYITKPVDFIDLSRAMAKFFPRDEPPVLSPKSSVPRRASSPRASPRRPPL